MTTKQTLTITGRIVRKGVGMSEGLIWVEAYLPFDPSAFADFQALAIKHSSDGTPNWAVAGAISPELAAKALDPIDSHGEAMIQEDVIALAHAYMGEHGQRMDVMHDQVVLKGTRVVETFCNTPEIESPHFAPGAWVTVIKLEPGSEERAQVDSGALDAVSFQANVVKIPIVVRAPDPETA